MAFLGKFHVSFRCVFQTAYWFLLLLCKHFQIFHISPVFLCPERMQHRIKDSFWTSLMGESCQPEAVCRGGLCCYQNFSPENSFLYSILTHFVAVSCSVMSDSSQPHGLQHARLPCPSPSPRVCLNSCPWVSDAIWPSPPLLPSSPFVFSLSQHQGLFQWFRSSHQVTKVLELQLQHQSFQWNQFNSVQPLSRVWLFGTPWTSLSITNSQSLLKLMSIE